MSFDQLSGHGELRYCLHPFRVFACHDVSYLFKRSSHMVTLLGVQGNFMFARLVQYFYNIDQVLLSKRTVNQYVVGHFFHALNTLYGCDPLEQCLSWDKVNPTGPQTVAYLHKIAPMAKFKNAPSYFTCFFFQFILNCFSATTQYN